jgi:hypothetical protein
MILRIALRWTLLSPARLLVIAADSSSSTAIYIGLYPLRSPFVSKLKCNIKANKQLMRSINTTLNGFPGKLMVNCSSEPSETTK